MLKKTETKFYVLLNVIGETINSQVILLAKTDKHCWVEQNHKKSINS